MNILDILRTIFGSFLNRSMLTALLVPIIAALLVNAAWWPFSVEETVAVIVTIILALTAGIAVNGAYDRENVKAGNVWNKSTKQWIKPEMKEFVASKEYKK